MWRVWRGEIRTLLEQEQNSVSGHITRVKRLGNVCGGFTVADDDDECDDNGSDDDVKCILIENKHSYITPRFLVPSLSP